MITKVELANLGTVNKNMVTLYGDNGQRLAIYYSYKTPIHYYYFNRRYDGIAKDERYTRVNDWSTTTGKFINEMQPDKKARVSGDLFEECLALALARL